MSDDKNDELKVEFIDRSDEVRAYKFIQHWVDSIKKREKEKTKNEKEI